MSHLRWLKATVALAAAGWLAACADVRPMDELWVPPRPYAADGAAVRPPASVWDSAGRGGGGEPEVVNPFGELTLAEAVRLALRQHPGLASAGWAVVAAEADAAQAGQGPNPVASFSSRNLGGPEAGETFVRHSLRLGRVIELRGKRRKRLALGRATQRLAAWDYEQRRLDVAAEAAKRFVHVVVAQRRVALAERQLNLAEAGHEIAEDLVRGGAGAALSRDQAAARVALSRVTLERARRALDADRADLAAAWGATEPRFTSAAGNLGERAAMPSMETLRGRLDASPMLARWRAELEQQRRRVDLERARTTPDPTVAAGARYFPDAGAAAAVVDVSWPLPLVDDRRHAVMASRLRLSKARADEANARVEAHQSLAQTHAALREAAYALRALDDEALPASRAAYESALASFRAGVTDYLLVLDAERTLLATEEQRLDAARDYHLSLIELERLTGHAIEPPDSP